MTQFSNRSLDFYFRKVESMLSATEKDGKPTYDPRKLRTWARRIPSIFQSCGVYAGTAYVAKQDKESNAICLCLFNIESKENLKNKLSNLGGGNQFEFLDRLVRESVMFKIAAETLIEAPSVESSSEEVSGLINRESEEITV